MIVCKPFIVSNIAAIQHIPAIPIVKKFRSLNPKCNKKGPENIKNKAIAINFIPFVKSSLFVLIIKMISGFSYRTML